MLLGTPKMLPETISDFSWIVWGVLVSPKINNIGFGSHGHVQKSRNHENEGFRFLPSPNWKVTSPKWSRMILWSSWPYLFHKLIIKWQTNCNIFQYLFLWFFYDFHKHVVLCVWTNHACFCQVAPDVLPRMFPPDAPSNVPGSSQILSK